MYKKSQTKKGFTITELIIAIVIIAVLSSVAYIGIQKTMGLFKNNRVSTDLIAIQMSLQQYFKDNDRMFPLPEPNGNMNILCFDSDASYAHDCDTASFRQGVIDNNLLTKRYLPEVPTDPWTDRTYAYGVTNDRKYFMIAGLQQNSDGTFSAFTITNIQRGFHLPSLIRSYSSRNFVTSGNNYLPYSPEYSSISAQLEDPPVDVTVTDDEGTPKFLDETLYPGDIITTGGSPVNIYFSDGSFSRLEENSKLQILDTSSVDKNDDDNIITKIKLKLFNGKIWNKVVRLAQKSEFNIETTSAIAGVRGTEFAVCVNDPALCPGMEKIIVDSGSVDVQKINTDGVPVGVTVTADAEFKPVYIDVGGNEISEEDVKDIETGSKEDSYIETTSAPLLHTGITPYITGFDILQKDNGYFIVRIGMNGFKAEDYENIQGFQVLDKDHFFNEFAERDIRPEIAKCLKEATHPGDCDGVKAVIISTGIEITAPYQAMYDTENKVYLLSWSIPAINDDNRYKQIGIVLRAYEYAEGGKYNYSDFSWPSVGFHIDKDSIVTEDLIVDFTDSSMYDKVARVGECRLKFISPATSPAGNMPLNPEFIWKPMPGCEDIAKYKFEIMELDGSVPVYNTELDHPVFSSDLTEDLEPSVNYTLRLTALNEAGETVIKKTLAFKTKSDTTIALAEYRSHYKINETVKIGVSDGIPLSDISGDIKVKFDDGIHTKMDFSFSGEGFIAKNPGRYYLLYGSSTFDFPVCADIWEDEALKGGGCDKEVSFYSYYLNNPDVNADYAIGNDLGTSVGLHTLSAEGMNIAAGDGNYIYYNGKDNLFPNSEITITVDKVELQTAPYSYLFDAVDDAGNHVELYKDNAGQLWMKVRKVDDSKIALNYFGSLAFLDSFPEDNIDIIFSWNSGTAELEIKPENADAPLYSGTPGGDPVPPLNFGSASRFYVGSKELGAVNTDVIPFGTPLQYTGFIKEIEIKRLP